MNNDALELLFQDTLKAEVATSAERLVDLEERVIMELGERRPRLRWHQWLELLLAPTRGTRLGQVAVVGATAAIFLFVGLTLSNRILPGADSPRLSLQPIHSADGTQEVLFVLPAMDATNVAVVGNFNAWEGTDLSDPDGDGIWTASIPLSPGRYEYAFIIDGRWWGQDPLADEYIESFGAYSSVRYIGRGGDGA
jgi:Glycogen recognition site of AMP-activated protein kinase